MKTKSQFFLISLLLSFLLLFTAAAAEELTVDGFTIQDSEGAWYVVAADESLEKDGTLILPQTLDGKTISGMKPSVIRESTKMLIYPREYSLNTENALPDHKLVFKAILYTDFMGLNPMELDLLPDIVSGEYALVDYQIVTIARNGSSMFETPRNEPLTMEQVPGELFGKKAYNLISPELIASQEGDWVYSLTGNENNLRASITGFKGSAADGCLVIPYKLGGYRVESINCNIIPEDVKMVYAPISISYLENLADGSRDFLHLDYISYEESRENGYDYAERYSDFTEGCYMLTAIQRCRITTSSFGLQGINDLIPAVSLRTEIDSAPLRTGAVIRQLTWQEGDWTYVRESGSSDAVGLLSYSGTPDSVLVVPETLAGHPVGWATYALIPGETKIVIVPDWDFYFSNEYMTGKEPERSFTKVGYISYERSVEKKRNIENNYSTFKPDTYMAVNITTVTLKDGDSASGRQNNLYPAADLPDTISGKPLLRDAIASYLTYTSGDYVYTVESDGELNLVSLPTTGEAGTYFVPYTVNDIPVRSLSLEQLPDDTHTIFMSNYTYLRDSRTFPQNLKIYYYYDYQLIKKREYTGSVYDTVREGEILLHGTMHCYTTEGKRETLVQDYYEYPTSINGMPILNYVSTDSISTYTNGLFTYYKLSPTEICICAFSNEEARKVEVPSTLDDLTVTSISSSDYNYVFRVNDAEEIILPDTLKVLGNRALYCNKIKALTLPEGLTEIGEDAINAYRVSKLVLPSTLQKIGPASMYISNQDLKLPDSVTYIAPRAFVDCYKLRTLTFPAGLTEIPAGVCNDLIRLQTVTIPESVVSIGASAFSGCKRLNNLRFNGTSLKTIADSAFVGCESLSNLKLPEGLEEIGYQAFYACKKLRSVDFPSTMKKLGAISFGGCPGLNKVTMDAGLTEIAQDAFVDGNKGLTVSAPEGSAAQTWAEANGYKFIVKKTK